MSQTSEIIKVDNVTEEERRRIEHNSRNRENLQNILNGTVSANQSQGTSEQKYPSLDAYRPLHTRREITFEDVQIPESVQRKMQEEDRVAQRASRAADFQSSIYASPDYRAAALRKERTVFAPTAEVEREDETLSIPTGTTLQYGKTTAQSQTLENSVALGCTQTATGDRVVFTAAEDSRAYYAALARKIAVAFAITFLVFMVVITVNSAILAGMNLEITQLEQTLYTLQEQVQNLQQAIAEETSWESIWEFIQASGMIRA